MAAKRFLPPSCEYVPVDIVRRAPETIVCDFNTQEPPDLEADWVLMSGVLEYLSDVGAALSWAARTAPSLSMSITLMDAGIPRLQRLTWGWIQHLARPELDALLDGAGYSVTQERTWAGQLLLTAVQGRARG